MKILVNASTLVVGGGVQVALNFIKYTLKQDEDDFYYIVSNRVYDQIKEDVNPNLITLIPISPAKIISGKKSKKVILDIEKKYNPDIVYSIGAPSYVGFKNTEVLRLTNPLIIGADKIALSSYSLKERLINFIALRIKRLYIKKNHFIITQTEDAKSRMIKNLNFKSDRIFVIPNTCSSIFYDVKKEDKTSDIINIFAFASPYPHKNIEIIPEVVENLVANGCTNFNFSVTIPIDKESKSYINFNNLCEKHSAFDYIENIGKVNFKDVPGVYAKSDILFLPTLLEVFSVTYLEAMASNVPIVTTNLSFSKSVCDNAAYYFEPKNSKDATKQLLKLINNKKERESLVSLGKKRLDNFQKEDTIYQEHLNTIKAIYNLKKHR
ncbi:glycosyltransferase [Tenacibaculum bernardetii]|uniref:glycosyltransferase n=1 Tax=Tenacibaculum bernardetii TaxID=3021375 RepID=UPI0023B0FEC9|nr:glycosyltransferase [Tenacibaculum bernardetii]